MHSHGQKPEVFMQCIDAGANKADVAIGELSNGPSHTNMRDMITQLVAKQGVTGEDIQTHPVMQQLTVIEQCIETIVKRKDIPVKNSKTMQSFDEKRTILRNLDGEDIKQYRVAAGALSALSNIINDSYENLAKEWKRTQIKDYPATQEELFTKVLENAPALWEKAGRFNTVTPGAKILLDQALNITLREISGKPVTMDAYIPEYNDVVTGRYGYNKGMEAEIDGCREFRDALMMYNALKVFNKAAEKGQVSKIQRDEIARLAALGEDGNRLKTEKSGFNLKEKHLETMLQCDDANAREHTGHSAIARN